MYPHNSPPSFHISEGMRIQGLDKIYKKDFRKRCDNAIQSRKIYLDQNSLCGYLGRYAGIPERSKSDAAMLA